MLCQKSGLPDNLCVGIHGVDFQLILLDQRQNHLAHGQEIRNIAERQLDQQFAMAHKMVWLEKRENGLEWTRLEAIDALFLVRA